MDGWMDFPLIPDVYLFSLALFVSGVVLLLQIYIKTQLSELKAEVINAEKFCRNANIALPLKVLIHSLMALLFLRNGYVFMFAVNFPVLFMELDALCTFDYFNKHEIMEPGQIASHMMYAKSYLMFYEASFAGYVVYVLVTTGIFDTLNGKPWPPFG